MRISVNDECDRPLPGPNTQAVTNAFVSVSLSPDIESGDEVIVKNACGDICIQDKDCDRLKGLNGSMLYCGIPTHLAIMQLGAEALLDTNAIDVIGMVLPGINGPADADTDGTGGSCRDSHQIELYAKTVQKNRCATDSNVVTTPQYVHFLFGKVINTQIANNFDFMSGPLQLGLTFYTEANPNWTPPNPAEWTAADQAAIRRGGPMAFKCTDTRPDLSPCDYSN
jgi:hypothetical protein